MSVKKGETVVLAGTKKGLFLARSRDRRAWKIEGPFFEGLDVYHATLDPRDSKTIWAAVASMHWGPTVQKSTTWGERWTRAPIAYPKESGLSVERVWNVTPGNDGDVWAGVEPAGLFRSTDDGKTWEGNEPFNAQPGRDQWMPGGGGLCLHTILPYPNDARRILVAASAVGIFGSGDAGASWRLMNGEIRSDGHPRGKTAENELGTCPHKLVRDAKDPSIVYMQNHWGVYKRRLGDSKWARIDQKLPSRFGFPMVAHPHDGGTVYTVPLVADMNRVTFDGAMAVQRTRDGGKTWQRLSKGLPQKNAWLTILREGLATDGKDPAGIYVGTTTGELFASRNEGDTWTTIAATLPPIRSIAAGIAG